MASIGAKNDSIDDQTRGNGAIRKAKKGGKRMPPKRGPRENNGGQSNESHFPGRSRQQGAPNPRAANALQNPEHVERCRRERIRMPNASKSDGLYFCTLCFYQCQSWDMVERHLGQQRHQELLSYHEERECSAKLPKPSEEQLEIISSLISEMVEEMGMKPFERLQRNLLASAINKNLFNYAKGCLVNLYGSSLAGGLKNSNVNLNLVVPPDVSMQDVMKLVVLYLVEHSSNQEVKLDFQSDLPKVIFDSKFSLLRCVLCINQQNAVEVGNLLSQYEDMDKRVRPLAVTFRLWAKECSLDRVDCGTLPPYAFYLMTIFYLQQLQEPILPVIHEIVERDLVAADFTPSELKTFEEWKSRNVMSIGELWWGLLHYYLIDFKMNERVVSIRTRREVLRSSKKWIGRGIAIEDPFQPKKNIVKHMGLSMCYQYFMNCLLYTYKYFTVPPVVNGPLPRERVPTQNHLPLDGAVAQGGVRDRELENINERVRRMTVQNGGDHTEDHDITNSGVIPPFRTPQKATQASVYTFDQKNFTGGKEVPKLCVICHEEGHTSAKCALDVLPKLESLPPKSPRFLHCLTCVCEYTFGIFKLDEVQYQFRSRIVQRLEDILKRNFSGLRLKMFGSSCNGFGLMTSDIDICATFTFNKTGKGLSPADIIESMARSLQKFPEFQDLIPVTTAKVPILKFYHPESRLEGDISLYNFLGEVNTKLLKTYSEIDFRVRILGLVMKRFAKLCGICDASRGSLSSYAYVLMVIHFLQQCQPPILPVLQELSSNTTLPVEFTENCNTYFYSDVINLPKIWSDFGKNKSSVGELWVELLCYYTEKFDYKNCIISIRQQAKLFRKDKFWSSSNIAIEDPFDITHNLASNLTRKMHTFIMKSLRKARLHFGCPRFIPSSDIRLLMNHFFDPQDLTAGVAPYDRGCHYCGKWGHKMRDCSLKKKRAKMGNNELDSRNPHDGKKPYPVRKQRFDRSQVKRNDQ